MRTIAYPCTNENLAAIVNGLDVNENDTVVTILGSGDQGLALLEKAKRVIAVDLDPQQTEFVQQRISMLGDNSIDAFLNYKVDGLDKYEEDARAARDAYFLETGRLERIRGKLRQFEIVRDDIITVLRKGLHTKCYFSNAIGYLITEPFPEKTALLYTAACGDLEAALSRNGVLAYVSNADEIESAKWSAENMEKRFFPNGVPRQWPSVEIDEELTEKATQHEHFWEPAVYRRKA